MEQKTCYYCGTKYPLEEECCPLCGQTEIEPEAIDEAPVELNMDPPVEEERESVKRGARAAKGSGVVSTIICILLALAVLAGALFILTSLGVVSFEKKPADDSSLTLPVNEKPTDVENKVLCTGIDLSPGNAAFNAVGSTVTLIVTTQPAGCTEEVTFESANEAVATVSPAGVVTAVGSGTTEITATCGEYAKSMQVLCEISETTNDVPPAVEVTPGSISFVKDDISMFSAGETATLSINGLPNGAEVQWATSNESVATVEDGVVTAVSGGTAIISATVGDASAKCIVRCKFEAAPETTAQPAAGADSDEAPFIYPIDVTVVPGETFVVRLVQNDARIQGVSWSTSDASVCTVEANGTVTIHGSGTAKITGTYGGVTYTCIVRCN